MNQGKFNASLDESLALLKDLELLKEVNLHRNYAYSPECSDYSRNTNYRTIYQSLVDFRDYDIQLFDESLLQMSFTNGDCRMLFIQNPMNYLSFIDFISEITDISELNNEDLGALQYSFEQEYEQSKDEMDLKIHQRSIFVTTLILMDEPTMKIYMRTRTFILTLITK